MVFMGWPSPRPLNWFLLSEIPLFSLYNTYVSFNCHFVSKSFLDKPPISSLKYPFINVPKTPFAPFHHSTSHIALSCLNLSLLKTRNTQPNKKQEQKSLFPPTRIEVPGGQELYFISSPLAQYGTEYWFRLMISV